MYPRLLENCITQFLAAGCSSSYTWLAYNGAQRTLECNSSQDMYNWWQRNTTQGSAECGELQQDDWVQRHACSNSRRCSVGVTSTTAMLEYCCTSGDNPASAAEGRCFNLASKCNSVTKIVYVLTSSCLSSLPRNHLSSNCARQSHRWYHSYHLPHSGCISHLLI